MLFRSLQEGDPPHPRKPPSNLLLGKAWTAASAKFHAVAQAATMAAAQPAALRVDRATLRHLADAAFAIAVPGPALAPPPVRSESGDVEFEWAGETARHVGIVAHRWLQRIALDGLERWDAARVRALVPAVRAALARRAVPAGEIDEAARSEERRVGKECRL